MKVRRAIELSESGLAKRPAVFVNEPAYAERMNTPDDELFVTDLEYDPLPPAKADEHADWKPYTGNAIIRMASLVNLEEDE